MTLEKLCLIMSEVVRPSIDALTAEDVGSLVLEKMLADNSKYEKLIEKSNAELLYEFVGSLPLIRRLGPGRSEVLAADPSSAKAIQSNILWYGNCIPTYVVGSKAQGKGKWTDLLVVLADDKEMELRKTQISTKKFGLLQEQAARKLSNSSSEKELFSLEKGELVINRDSKGNLAFESCKPLRSPYFKPLEGLSNDDFKLYDVMGHLFKLAVTFDKVPVLDHAPSKEG